MWGLVNRSMRTVALAMVLCLVWVSSALSATPDSPKQPDVTDEIISLATKVSPHLVRNKDGTFTLTAKAKDLKVSQEAFDRFSKALDGINGEIRLGHLTSDSKGNIHVTNEGNKSDGITTQAVCKSYTVRLSEAQTVRMEAQLNMLAAGAAGVAAIAAAIAAFIPPTIPVAGAVALAVGIFSAGAWFFASWMQYVDNGKGVTLKWKECARVPIYLYPVGN